MLFFFYLENFMVSEKHAILKNYPKFWVLVKSDFMILSWKERNFNNYKYRSGKYGITDITMIDLILC